MAALRKQGVAGLQLPLSCFQLFVAKTGLAHRVSIRIACCHCALWSSSLGCISNRSYLSGGMTGSCLDRLHVFASLSESLFPDHMRRCAWSAPLCVQESNELKKAVDEMLHRMDST
jgi:hypothetical protein